MSKLKLQYIRPCPSYLGEGMSVTASEIVKALETNEYIAWIPPA